MHFPLNFWKKTSPLLFHGAFAQSFIWSRRPWREVPLWNSLVLSWNIEVNRTILRHTPTHPQCDADEHSTSQHGAENSDLIVRHSSTLIDDLFFTGRTGRVTDARTSSVKQLASYNDTPSITTNQWSARLINANRSTRRICANSNMRFNRVNIIGSISHNFIHRKR